MRLLRPTWFEIDVDAAVDNLRAVRRLVGPGRKIVAVVKADAYGFGSLEMGRAFAAHGADALGVADLADGVRLRDAGLTLPILMYPNALPEAADDVIGADLIPTLTDLDAARAYDDAAARRARPADVFVKVDVGLERLGVPADQAVKLALAIRDLAGLRLAGLCTHLHVPTGADPAYVEWQFGRFTAELDALATQGVDVPIRLAASSPLVLGFPSTYLNAVDPGRMLYGYGHEAVAGPVVLRPTFRAFKSRLVEVKDLTPPGRRGDHARRDRGAPHHQSARAGAGRRAARGSRLRWKRRGRPSRRRQPHGGRRLMRNRLLAGLDRLRQANERLGRFMNAAAGWLFVVCSLFVSFDVLARKFFNVSSRATVELTGYMLAFGIAWGLCDALTTRAHIRVDVLVTKMPLRLRAFMHALALAFLALLAFFFVWRGWAVVHDSWEFGAHDSSALTIPLVVPQALWAFGITVFFALTVIMLAEVVILLTLGRRAEVDRMLGPRTLVEEAEEALEAAGLPVPEAAVR